MTLASSLSDGAATKVLSFKFMGLKLKIWARKGVKMALKYPRVP